MARNSGNRNTSWLIPFLPQIKRPPPAFRPGEGNSPGDDLLSQGLSPHYHRRCSVSLPGSEWDRVVPPRSGHQRARFARGPSEKTKSQTRNLPPEARPLATEDLPRRIPNRKPNGPNPKPGRRRRRSLTSTWRAVIPPQILIGRSASSECDFAGIKPIG